MKKISINYIFNKAIGRQSYVRVLRLAAPKISLPTPSCEAVLNGLNITQFEQNSKSFMSQLSGILDDSKSQRIENVDTSNDSIRLTVEGHKTFVMTTQADKRQIWYSSPVSGPQRFSFSSTDQTWRNDCNQELSRLLFKEIDLV